MRPIAITANSISPARLAIAALFAALLLATVSRAAENNPARTRPKAESPATAERIIVKFREGSRVSVQATTSGESAAADSNRMNALASRARISVNASRALGANMHVMLVTPQLANETAAETLARLRADSDVEFAVLDRRVYAHATTTNDPGFTNQWYLQATQPSAINAITAWDTTLGSNGVVIAVVDTGVLFGHPDLLSVDQGGRFLPGYDFVSADGSNNFRTANDGNGRDADASDPGDWVSASDGCGATSDSSWHGTRVSGIIGALTNNSTGVSGINWNGYILPVRVLGKCGGYNSDVLAGIRWAAGLSVPGVPNNPYPARVINVSLGGEGSCDAASQSAISEVAATGALVVVSAGNEGGPVDSPANCAGAMAILGLRHAGTKVGFSSLGPEIALGAPGGNCFNLSGPCLYSIDTTSNAGTTVPGAHNYTDQINFNVGTSFSSPIVSGIAGLMLSVNGNLKASQLIARMQNGATKPFPTTSETAGLPVCHTPSGLANDIQGTECVCTTAVCGAGMANANGAVNEALRPIAALSAPTNVTAGASVALDGSGSAAACGHTISTYAWSVISGTAVLTSTNMPTTTIQAAPTSGTATIRLTVTDEVGKTDTADVVVSSTNTSTTAPSNAGTQACLTSLSVPSAVTITASDSSASEAGPDSGTFTLTRTGDTTDALVVNISTSGTATSGTDYTALSSTVTIAAGQATATLTVTPIDDTANENSETVMVSVTAASAYTVGSPSSATVTIADNDVSPSGNNGGGGGGGGAFDLLTLLATLSVTAGAIVRRRRQAARVSA